MHVCSIFCLNLVGDTWFLAVIGCVLLNCLRIILTLYWESVINANWSNTDWVFWYVSLRNFLSSLFSFCNNWHCLNTDIVLFHGLVTLDVFFLETHRLLERYCWFGIISVKSRLHGLNICLYSFSWVCMSLIERNL